MGEVFHVIGRVVGLESAGRGGREMRTIRIPLCTGRQEPPSLQPKPGGDRCGVSPVGSIEVEYVVRVRRRVVTILGFVREHNKSSFVSLPPAEPQIGPHYRPATRDIVLGEGRGIAQIS